MLFDDVKLFWATLGVIESMASCMVVVMNVTFPDKSSGELMVLKMLYSECNRNIL